MSARLKARTMDVFIESPRSGVVAPQRHAAVAGSIRKCKVNIALLRSDSAIGMSIDGESVCGCRLDATVRTADNQYNRKPYTCRHRRPRQLRGVQFFVHTVSKWYEYGITLVQSEGNA